MKMNFKMRALTLVASVALLGGTAFVASGQTGAYFSSTVQGDFTGTVGSIQITPSSPTDIGFTNLLPGVPQTISVSYENSGSSAEDVYLDFNDVAALSALNSLGHYGAVTITSSGDGASGSVFYSSNLNDNITSCGFFANTTSTQTFKGESGPGMNCWPVPDQLLIAGNVPSGAGGTFYFTFEYSSYLSGQSGAYTEPWNTYPAPGGQTFLGLGDSGTGLPFQLVATQVGITPGQTGYNF